MSERLDDDNQMGPENNNSKARRRSGRRRGGSKRESWEFERKSATQLATWGLFRSVVGAAPFSRVSVVASSRGRTLARFFGLQ